jgi:hypothetical protein
MNPCQYSTLFGIPGEGIHKYRIFNIAIVDLLATFAAAWLFAKIFEANLFISILVFLFLGILAHRIFCVKTTIDKYLFSD